MENSDSLGIFITRADALESSFPKGNASGLWQVWRMPDGHYIVQPVDEHMQPQGTLAMMSAEDFVFSLAPLPSDEDITAVGRRFLQADAPDLLDIWYERLMAEKNRGKTPDAGRTALAGTPSPVAAQDPSLNVAAPAPLEPDEAPPAHPEPGEGMPAPAFHAQGGLFETSAGANAAAGSGEGLPYAAPDAVSSSDDGPEAIHALGPDAVRHMAAAAPGSLFAGSADAGSPELPSLFAGPDPASSQNDSLKDNSDYCADEAFYEKRRAMLEDSMRAEISSLLEQLDDSPYPALEEEVEKLLLRGGSFTWKQKFMFSEFGMMLRRKGKARLALLAHERALNLAPGDGHILFNLARSEYELGNMAAVSSYLNQALEVLPDFAPARNFLAFLEGGQGPVKDKDPATPQ